MTSVFRVLNKQVAAWSIGHQMLLLVFITGLSLPVAAEDEKSLSPSVVLVLKLVSKTHVKPTTGIVISDDGLVLVPAGVIKEEGEIVVLDNGADIAVNGRPAVVVDKPMSGGLALLSVEGLKRPGIVLSANALETDQSLHLETFPPAKFMAEGAQPLWVPLSMSKQSNMRAAISPDTPLPFVTGPLIDECGYLAGLSLALGPPSLDRDKLTVVVFTDELTQIFDAMGVSLPSAYCGKTKKLDTEEEINVLADTQEPELQKSETGTAAEEPVTDIIIDQPATGSSEPLYVPELTNTEPPSLWLIVPAWLWLLGLLVVAILTWKGVFFLRLLKHPQQSTDGNNLSAADEPDTARLGSESEIRPRSAPIVKATAPDMNQLPPSCDAVVIIEATLDADKPFRRFCAVNSAQIDISIGRGQTDMILDHPGISREHARLMGTSDSLTFSDLGSSNGTFINGTPCLPTEIMFIEIDDEIVLGKVQLRFTIARNQTELT